MSDSSSSHIARLVRKAFTDREREELTKHISFAEFLASARTVEDFEQLCCIGQELLRPDINEVRNAIRHWNAELGASAQMRP